MRFSAGGLKQGAVAVVDLEDGKLVVHPKEAAEAEMPAEAEVPAEDEVPAEAEVTAAS